MTGTRIGYARTSTIEQEAGLEAQLRDLQTLGCMKVFSEKVSSVGKRPQLENALDYLREGDILTVTKLDRLARNTFHLGEILSKIQEKGADLHVVSLGMDTSTATGRVVMNVMMSIAQFEREVMLERQREGIAKAASQGKYKGRKPTARAKSTEVTTLLARGIGPSQIADQLGIARSSVYRIIERQKNTPTTPTVN